MRPFWPAVTAWVVADSLILRSRAAALDVLVVPSGVPHQFVDASDPFLYLVAKVEA